MKNHFFIFILFLLVSSTLLMISGCNNITGEGVEPGKGNSVSRIYLANKDMGGFFIFTPDPTTPNTDMVTLDANALVSGIAITPDKKKLVAIGIKPDGSYPATKNKLFIYTISNEAVASFEYTYSNSNDAFGSYILGLSSDGGTVYIAKRRTVGIFEISTSTGAITHQYNGVASCDSLTPGVVASDGTLYFGNTEYKTGGNIYKYNTTTHTIVATVDLGADGNPYAMKISGTKLYVPMSLSSTSHDVVDIINLGTFTKDTHHITVDDDPFDVSFSNNGNGYTANYASHNVTPFSIVDNIPGTSINIPATTMGPNKIIVDDVNHRLYVNGYTTATIAIISTITNTDVLDYPIPFGGTGTDQMTSK